MADFVSARTYCHAESIVFLKTKERFGGLSNMAAGFPIEVNGLIFKTSEALYQACRFPQQPNIQRLIIEERSPMTAKMRSKPYRELGRSDWLDVRVQVMRWCLRAKLVHNFERFAQLLESTGDKPIVEMKSRGADFWGAINNGNGELIGPNVLGRLLMELRRDLRKAGPHDFMQLYPLNIPDFILFERSIEPLVRPKSSQSLFG